MNVGEMSCVDRCAAKFMEASQLVAQATTNNAEQVWGGGGLESPPIATLHSMICDLPPPCICLTQAQKILQSQQAILGK